MNCASSWVHLLLLVWLGLARADPLLVQVENGQLRGKDNGGFYSYEGIPYAEPPVGQLRFEAPQPYKRQWSETFDASQRPEYCLQWSMFLSDPNRLLGKEDCLTLSVYKPKNESRSSFPVMAYIHGGAFMFGGVMEHGHHFLMADGNFIMVKINYRLGPLGFLSAGDADLSGNFGLKDQRLALKWINANIASFGGEPDNVLLMGNSAGGASVHYQLLHGGLEGLVKVAAAQSGLALAPWSQQTDARAKAFKVGQHAGCSPDSTSLELKKCLQTKDPEDIVRAVPLFLVFDYVPFAPFGPSVEAAGSAEPFLMQEPEEVIKSGKFSQVPFLVSYTSEDGGFNAAMFLKKQADGKELIDVLNTRWNELGPDLLFYRHDMKSEEELNAYSQKLKQQYLGDRDFSVDSYLDMQRLFTDILFKWNTQRTLELTRLHSQSPLYCYVYDNPPESGVGHLLSGRNDVYLGTVHTDDLYLYVNSTIHSELRADEQIISKHFMNMFLDFVENDKGTLSYDSCTFRDMAGQEKLQVVAIKRDSCELLEVDQIP